jgi:hypothetical protein
MGKNRKEVLQKADKTRSDDIENPNRFEAFLKFKQTVEKELEDAILERMKAFRDKILKSTIRKSK